MKSHILIRNVISNW